MLEVRGSQDGAVSGDWGGRFSPQSLSAYSGLAQPDGAHSLVETRPCPIVTAQGGQGCDPEKASNPTGGEANW